MKQILVTGATGNVGRAVLDALAALPDFGTELAVTAGLRDPARLPPALAARGVRVVRFDLEDAATFASALAPGQRVFLLRPPQLAKGAPFVAFVAEAARRGVGFLVFLSVQGVEKSSVIPHHKIEKLIAASGIPYCFLRPGYFMENLTTVLRDELRAGALVLPAGRAPFNWIGVADIGRVAARVLADPGAHHGAKYDLTGPENLSFPEVLARIERLLGRTIRYDSPGPLRFLYRRWRAKQPLGYAAVVLLLHYLPRFQAAPPLSDAVARITGRPPATIDELIATDLRAALDAPACPGPGLLRG